MLAWPLHHYNEPSLPTAQQPVASFVNASTSPGMLSQSLSAFSAPVMSPATVAQQQALEQRFLQDAWKCPTFCANRICTWCAKFCAEEHINTCEKRLVVCPICQEYCLATDAVQHYQRCQERVVTIATDRVVKALADRQRREDEDNERRRVALLHQQAEADAAALRQRAASIVTSKKQSLSNLLFSGVSIGDEHVTQQPISESNFQQAVAPKRSLVRILSQPEIASATPPQQLPAETTTQSEDAVPSVYNRVGSFFAKTNEHSMLPSSASSARLSVVEAPTRVSIAHAADAPTLTQATSSSALNATARPSSADKSAAAPLPSAQQLSRAQSLAWTPSISANFTSYDSTVGAGRRQTTGGIASSVTRSSSPPASLPQAQMPANLSVPASRAPQPDVPGKKIQAPQTLPKPLVNRPQAAADSAPPSVFPGEATAQHRAPLAPASSIMSLESMSVLPRGASVESIARAASTTSSSAIVNGMKRCKWCGQQALVEHEKKCASRIVMCKKCNSMIKMKDKEEHVKICAALRAGDSAAAPA